jgi:3-oxoacyl-[acyl-carrier protein] reductase
MKTALIWGAGGGIGQAITKQLARENWQVLALGRNLNSFTDFTVQVYDVELDDAFSVQSAITAIGQEVGEVDLWAYAAGYIASLRVNEMRPHDWQRIIQTNLTGAFLATHFSWPLLSEQAGPFSRPAGTSRCCIDRHS